jgi:predicted Zn-dependent protease
MLRDILSKLDQPHEYEFKLFISTDGNGNAMARPGGFIYVDDELISKAALHPKAHFALSHEVAHVLQRHETKELQSTIVDSIPARDDLVKLVRELSKNPRAILGHVTLRKDLFTRHHIDQELHADACGARLLSRALGDLRRVAASINAFLNALPRSEPPPRQPAKSDTDKLAASVQDLVETPVKRHPTSEERRRNLQAIYDDIRRKDASGR